MNILVLVKPVPDPEKYSEITIDPLTKCVVRRGVDTVINPTDKNAIEGALQIKEERISRGERGDGITVLSMAPDFVRSKILSCLAMGADEGYLLSDAVFSGADTYATSYVLAEAIKKIEALKGNSFDIILAGNSSADGGTAHVPAQVAEWLAIEHINSVCEISTDDLIHVTRETENEFIEYEGSGRVVLSVTRRLNKPRLINTMGVIKARKKPLTVWSNEDLKLSEDRLGLAGSPTEPGELTAPDTGRSGQFLKGDTPEEAAEEILAIINKAGV